MDFLPKNKLIYILLIFALLFSGISLFNRYEVEQENRGVELVFDSRQLDKLNESKEKLDLSTLKNNNVSGIAVYEDTLNHLISESKLKLVKGNELKRQALISDIKEEFKRFSYKDDSAFLIFSDYKLISRIKEAVSLWDDYTDIEFKTLDFQSDGGERFLVFFPEWENSYLSLSLGFDQNFIDRIKKTGLNVIPRLENYGNSVGWDDRIDQYFLDKLSSDLIIFAGDTITGYPDKLTETSKIMRKNDIKLGMIEAFIGNQQGVNNLAHLLDYNLLRVHSIQQGEMEKYSLKKVVDRYLRAVRERNVRVLYLKPFMTEKADLTIDELNKKFLSELKAGLINDGFIPGDALPFSYFSNSILFLCLIGLGLGGAGIILLERLLGIKFGKISYFLLFLFLITEIFLIYLNKTMFLRKILALGSCIVFPSLAVITQFIEKRKDYLKSFFRAVGISLIGIVIMTASLAHISFLVKVDQFRGVKIAFIMPTIAVFWYYLRKRVTAGNSFKDYFQAVKDFIDIEIKIKHIILVGFIGGIGLVYLARSGNYSFLPVLDFEIWLRRTLEDLLYVRPRFKAFLIGHPIFIIGLYYRKKIRSFFLMVPIIILSVIGQITILNTFAHIHIPLKISLFRVFHGIWLGLVVGFIGIYLIRLIQRGKERWIK